MPEAEAELVDLPTVLSAMQEQNEQFRSFMIDLQKLISLEVAGTHTSYMANLVASRFTGRANEPEEVLRFNLCMGLVYRPNFSDH